MHQADGNKGYHIKTCLIQNHKNHTFFSYSYMRTKIKKKYQVVCVLERMWQEDCQEFYASLNYGLRSAPKSKQNNYQPEYSKLNTCDSRGEGRVDKTKSDMCICGNATGKPNNMHN